MKNHGLSTEAWMSSATCMTDSAGENAQYMYEKGSERDGKDLASGAASKAADADAVADLGSAAEARSNSVQTTVAQKRSDTNVANLSLVKKIFSTSRFE